MSTRATAPMSSQRAAGEFLAQDGAVTMKTHAAIIRTLIDEVEHHVQRGKAAEGLRGQLIEELARLGARILETAAALSATTPMPASSEAE